MSKKDKKIEKIRKTIKKLKMKKVKCDHIDFWSMYKIINFRRYSMKGKCSRCGEKISLKYLWHDALSKNIWVRLFAWILWMSPAFLIITIAFVLAPIFGPIIYVFAIIDVVIFHFWAMYYIVKWGLVEVQVRK